MSNLQNEFVYGVTDESDKIDLSYLFTRIMTSYYVPINHLNEYKYTQFITDYIRKSRIDGIIYKSFYSYNGSNYTIFNSSRDIIEFIDSKIMLLQSERRTFLDFNDDKVIHAKTIVGASYDKKSSDIMKKNLRNKIMLE